MDTFLLVFGAIVLLFGFVVFFGAPYVPSRKVHFQPSFDALYAFTKKDVLLDLGSGDGVVLREVARRGARAIGYELNPVLCWLANWLSRRYGSRARTKVANMWTTPFPEGTTIIYVFVVSRDVKKLCKRIQGEVNRLGRDISVISYGCSLDDFTPTKTHQAHFLYKISPLQMEKPQV